MAATWQKVPIIELELLPASLRSAKSLGERFYYTGRICKNGHKTYSLTSQQCCAGCVYEKAKRHNSTNKAKRAAIRRAYRAKNPEIDRTADRKRYQRDKEKRIAWQRRYRELFSDKLKQQQRVRYAGNPDLWKKHNALRRMRMRIAKVETVSAVLLRNRQGGACYYCGVPIGVSYEIDHRIPIARGGEHTMANCVATCKKCNRQKHSKTDYEFAIERLQA